MRFFSITLFLITQLCFAQKQLFIGTEFGITSDIFENVGSISTSKRGATNGFIGLNFQKDVSENFSWETGFRLKYYVASSINYKGINYNPNYSSAPLGNIKSFQIPVRVKFKHNMGDDKVNLIGTIGGILGTYASKENSLNARSINLLNSKGDVIVINESSTKIISRFFPMLETGIGLEFNTGKFRIETVVNYAQGFSKISEIYTAYAENGKVENYVQKSNGSFLSLLITLKYKL